MEAAVDRKTVEQHESRLGEIQTRMQEIDKEYAGQALPDDQRKEFEDLQQEKQDTVRTVEELREREAWIGELADEPKSRESGATFHTRRQDTARGDDIWDLSTVRASVSNPEEATSELRTRALRAIEGATFPHERANHEDTQGHVERLLAKVDTTDAQLARMILHTGSPTYRRAFSKQLVGSVLNNEEQRALGLGGSSGGYALPFTLDPTIIPTSNSVVNPVRAISRVESIVGSNTWNGVSSPAVSATRVAELTEASDNAPTLVQPTATVTKAQVFIPYSIEIGEDWGALESEFARLIQDSKDDEEATAFVTGAGSGVNPQGFVTGTTNTVAAATGLTVTAANVYALEAALPPRYRPRETFVANRGIYNVIRGIDTAGGAALWLYVSQGLNNQVPAPGNTGALLLGRPAYEASQMQATVVNATKIMVVGDFSRFLVLDRIGLTVEVVPHIFGTANRFPIGQRGLYAYWRNTSKVLDANAFRALQGN
jgi:HK97 family phage major capsid protein